MTFPLSDRGMSWDSGAANTAVTDWATSNGSLNFGKYGQAFAIKGDGKTKGTYKLPFATVSGGHLMAVWAGVTAAAAALQGARGGVQATAGQKSAAKATLAGYYSAARKKFGDESITPPWSQSAAPAREVRTGGITGVDQDAHGFWAKVVSYGPVDSYGTRWQQGVFSQSLAEHLPVLAWGHDWSEPIGRADDHKDAEDGQYVHFRLDDPEFVPRAKQALHQLRSGTLTDVSVGIMRREDHPNDDNTTTITRADLDETSLVLRGAVPGAKVMSGSVRSVRSQPGSGIAIDDVVELGRRVQAGDISMEEAQTAISLLDGRLGETVSSGVFDEVTDDTEVVDLTEENPFVEIDKAIASDEFSRW